jgi:MFS family permease
MLGAAGAGTSHVPYLKVLSNWFDRRRGLALGLIMFGLGVGAIVVPPLAQHLITAFGWRGAYAAIGLLVALVCIPVASLLRETPAEMGSLPDGETRTQTTISERPHIEGVCWNEAWRDRTFWVMVSVFFLVGASVHGCVVHMAPMLTDRGITAERAALVSSFFGAAVLMSRLISGYLLDRFFAPRLAMVFFSGAALGIGLLWSGASGPAAFLGAFLVGLGMGAEGDLIAYLISRFFGLRYFGEIYGYAFASYVLAGALGPWFMGFGFDRTSPSGPV